MGMGSFAVNSFVIGYDDLKKICPDEIAAIESEQYFQEVGWDSLGKWLAWDDPEVLTDSILDALDNEYEGEVPEIDLVDRAEKILEKYDCHVIKLRKAFNNKTELGLYFDHYDEDGGDRYDCPNDKDGCIFCVDGMVVLSPAGEKYKDIITERRWPQFG